MQVKVLLIFLFLFTFACQDTRRDKSDPNSPATGQQIAFDEAKWKTKKGRDYPYRDSMLEDVISNSEIRKLKKEQILELLGEPDRIDDNYLFYRITQTRLGLWPLHTKTMVIKLTADNTIEWIKIHK